MTCADGTNSNRIAKHKLALKDQPKARNPRNMTKAIAPSSSEAEKRIHCRFCTLLVWP